MGKVSSIVAIVILLVLEYCFGELTLKNDYIKLTLDEQDSTFVLETILGDPEITSDDNKCLLYYGSYRKDISEKYIGSSYTTIRIDDKNYKFGTDGEYIKKPYIADKKVISKSKIANLTVTQEIKCVENLATLREDTILIRYTIQNNDTQIHKVGLRILLDTLLGENDEPSFSVPKKGIVSTGISFEREIPDFVYALDGIGKPSVLSQCTFVIPESENIPDRVILGRWRPFYKNLWLPEEFVPGGTFKRDSAIIVYWLPKELSPGEIRNYAILYGVYGIVTKITDYLNIALSIPARVRAGKNITATCDIENITTEKVANLRAKIVTEENSGLKIKSEKSILLGDCLPKEVKNTTWIIFPAKKTKEKIAVVVTGTFTDTLTGKTSEKEFEVSKEIQVIKRINIGDYGIDAINKKLSAINLQIEQLTKEIAEIESKISAILSQYKKLQ